MSRPRPNYMNGVATLVTGHMHPVNAPPPLRMEGCRPGYGGPMGDVRLRSLPPQHTSTQWGTTHDAFLTNNNTPPTRFTIMEIWVH